MTTSDTPETLPDFSSAEEYLEFMSSVSQLPKGFATGTGSGTFVSQETPGLGNLKIRVALIQLTDGPSDSWAACFTSNKVSAIEKISICMGPKINREKSIPYLFLTYDISDFLSVNLSSHSFCRRIVPWSPD